MALAAANQQNPLNSLANSLSNSGGSATLTNSNPMALGGSNTNGSEQDGERELFGHLPHHFAELPALQRLPGSPRKKRAKVTDSVRGPRASAVRDSGHSLPTSNRSSPQPSSYFPPTMVAHPLFNNANFKLDNGGRSPGNSDISDYEGDNSFIRYSVRAPISNLHHRLNGSFNSMLTHVHLRKAKLMFFYTRYPNSAVLKTYFPDINFNKNNTAQLVKWFSNFREFYYMQMEKYAKQALAEGITDANDITVTTDSEIFRTLNQHYNRNNFISPPDSLAGVIEETLKEFFRALRDGRDSEPSWKKAIYKVIQQLDEQIPDFFKTQQFMTQLEGNPQP
ncbi:Prospero domain-containing protein [Aphelenchoides fujianensis]|nr:Prospero domain-containing protein [Aphelenchoides fujianensis]